jgi:hypothetical protein|tara:strand:- start:2641 stop:3726 length:1086 start_codon:yes stop_codon:yes gene_type:complete
MIHIFDMEVTGQTHQPFNSALLNILRLAHPDRDLIFHGSASHIECLIGAGLPDRCTTVEEQVKPVSDAAYAEAVAGGVDGSNIVLLGAQARHLRALAADKRLRAGPPIDAITHSELAQPAHWRSRNPFHRRKDMFGTLKRLDMKNLRLVVLEPAIVDVLQNTVHPRSPVAVLPHPVPALVAHAMERPVPERPRISFIGGTFVVKGFAHFADAARAGRDRFDFAVVGARADKYDGKDDALFAVPPAIERFDRPSFEAAVCVSDLICLPLDAKRYSLAASGTLLDCVAYGIPVLTTMTAVTRDWQRRYGRFGYLVERGEDMAGFIASLTPDQLQGDAAEFKHTLAKIAADRTVEALARRFTLS